MNQFGRHRTHGAQARPRTRRTTSETINPNQTHPLLQRPGLHRHRVGQLRQVERHRREHRGHDGTGGDERGPDRFTDLRQDEGSRQGDHRGQGGSAQPRLQRSDDRQVLRLRHRDREPGGRSARFQRRSSTGTSTTTSAPTRSPTSARTRSASPGPTTSPGRTCWSARTTPASPVPIRWLARRSVRRRVRRRSRTSRTTTPRPRSSSSRSTRSASTHW
jgi:hypothetical protein